TVGNETGRRRLAEETAITRTVLRTKNRRLSLEAKDASERVRLAEQHRRIVRQIASGEVVRSVHNDIEVTHDFERVHRVEPSVEGLEMNVWIHIVDAIARRVEFGATDVGCTVQDLSMQVGCVHDIEVNQSESADAGSREIQGARGAQTTGSDQQDASIPEATLPFDAYLIEDEVTRVAEDLFRAERRKSVAACHGHRDTPPLIVRCATV